MESRYNIRTIVRNIDRHHRERGTGMTVRELAAAMGLPNPNSGAAVGKAHRLQDVLISAGICQSNRCNTASAKHLAAGLMLSKASRAILQDQNKDEYWEVGSRQLKNQILRLVAGLQIPKNQVVDNEYSPLTNVQLQALRSLAEFQNQFKRSPTRRELADRLGCALGNVQNLLAQLQARGHLESDRATLTAIGRAAIKGAPVSKKSSLRTNGAKRNAPGRAVVKSVPVGKKSRLRVNGTTRAAPGRAATKNVPVEKKSQPCAKPQSKEKSSKWKKAVAVAAATGAGILAIF